MEEDICNVKIMREFLLSIMCKQLLQLNKNKTVTSKDNIVFKKVIFKEEISKANKKIIKFFSNQRNAMKRKYHFTPTGLLKIRKQEVPIGDNV